MESVSLPAIVDAFRAVGIRRGDIVNVHSRLIALGRLQNGPASDLPDTYLRALQEVVGAEGTIVVPTFTTTFARYGQPFILEESPSEMGVFSEHVRRQPGARRTLHPVQSLTALGARAAALADNHPRWNVGHDTVWDRMLRHGARFLGLGISAARSMSFMHQVEYLACVPYVYNKVMIGDVRAGGRPVDGAFQMAVRYLEYGVAYDLAAFERHLREQGALTEVTLGGGVLHMVPLPAAFEIGIAGLRRDPYYILKSAPAFVAGKPPWDGITIAREGAAPRYFLA